MIVGEDCAEKYKLVTHVKILALRKEKRAVAKKLEEKKRAVALNWKRLARKIVHQEIRRPLQELVLKLEKIPFCKNCCKELEIDNNFCNGCRLKLKNKKCKLCGWPVMDHRWAGNLGFPRPSFKGGS